MNKWITENDIGSYPELSQGEAKEALSLCVSGVLRYLDFYKDAFPGPASFDGNYIPGPNKGWTTGFYTGQVWLAYENAENDPDRQRLLDAGNAQVDSFYQRICNLDDVEHHDLGFLYSPSCVAAYKLTGNQKAHTAALLAADKLITRFQKVGEFIQAWGEMGASDNYRFIIDCLLNLPLLYWATEETGDNKYKDIAERHIHTAMNNVIRDDDSTWHTVFMNNRTGAFDHGATCQGYKDGSAWARGQAWGVYGTAVAYKYTKRDEYKEYFRRVTGYFLNHLPDDLCPFWDLTFGNGDEKTEPRDSSSAVIASCGMLEMSKYLDESQSSYYTDVAKKLLKTVTDKYRVTDIAVSNGRVLHGTYSKKSPYNTCTPEGVDECVLWGDYYYMEALNRMLNPAWEIYW